MRLPPGRPLRVSVRRPAPRAAALAALLVVGLAAGGCRGVWPRSGGTPGTPGTPDEQRPPSERRAALPPPTTGPELVQRMHQRWTGRWYRSIQYLQANTITSTTGRETLSQWMNYQEVPGRLRVEFLPASQKSGVLFVNNVQRIFTNGKVTDTRRLYNGVLTLGADVYSLPPEETLRALDSLRIDESKFYATRGVRQMYIVGAVPGDTSSNQFWVDADSMLLRRFVQRTTRQGRTTVSDTRITYQNVDGFPVPREITHLRNGRPYMRQVYGDVRVNAPIPDELFDPAHWSSTARP